MPIIKSAKKRVKVANKAAVRNSKTKRSLKTALKAFTKKPAAAAHSSIQSELDKAVKKGIMHKNKAARLKKQAAAKAKAAGVKPAAAKKTASKAAAKPATKKAAPAKKTPAAKKPAAKKTSSKK
jgi:ribosomal protein S20